VRTMEEKELRELAELLMKYFVIRDDKHKRKYPKEWVTLHEPLRFENVVDHLQGSYCLGVFMIHPASNLAKTICIDIDVANEEIHKKAIQLAKKLEQPFLAEKTGGAKHDGLHIWYFFEPRDAKDLWELARLLRKLFAEHLDLDREKVEGLPDKPNVVEALDKGVRLPLGRDPQSGKWSRFVNENLEEIDPLLALRSIQYINYNTLLEKAQQEYAKILLKKAGAEFLGDFLKVKKEVKWICKDLLPKKGLIVFYGPGGIGKTFLNLLLAIDVATGQRLFGRYDVNSNHTVLFIDEENSEEILYERFNMLLKNYGKLYQELAKNNVILISRKGFNLQRGSMYIRSMKTCKDWIEWLKHVCSLVDIVIIDNWSVVSGYIDENDAKQVTLALGKLKDVAEETNTLIILTHHTKKEQPYISNIAELYRGSSAFRNVADISMALYTYEHEPDRRFLRISKNRLSGFENIDIILRWQADADGNLVIEWEGEKKAIIPQKIKCARAIENWIEEEGIVEFRRKDVVEVMEKLGFSRSVVDEALKELVSMGKLSKSEERRGVYLVNKDIS